ncbi:MAG: calcium-binding protein [Candidatus Caenarcaniphilales bacterium]|nr:calcium-binding protein [Candidatus Caenarcaniphilales bacterium]
MATIVGTTGDDIFTGQVLSTGNNYIGLGGLDKLSYSLNGQEIIIQLGLRSILNGGSIDTFQGIEQIIVPISTGGVGILFANILDASAITSTDFTDPLKGIYFNASTGVLRGFVGTDKIVGNLLSVIGSDRDDLLIGSRKLYEEFDGGDGNDRIYGKGGYDQIFGGDGNDELYGGALDDFLVGGIGNDRLFGAKGDDRFTDEEGDDFFSGGAGNDDYTFQVFNSFGDNIILDNLGISRLVIESSIDTTISLIASDIFDEVSNSNGTINFSQRTANRIRIVYSGQGNDTILGSGSGDSLNSQEGDDVINAGAGDDTVNAGDGDDQVFGEAGADRIFAGAGNDTLDGGIGDDFLYGGADDDIYILSDGRDLISDDSGIDILDFGNILSTQATLSAQDFDLDGNFDGLRIVLSPSNQVDIQNYFDDLIAVGLGQGALTTADFGAGLIESLEFGDITLDLNAVVASL